MVSLRNLAAAPRYARQPAGTPRPGERTEGNPWFPSVTSFPFADPPTGGAASSACGGPCTDGQATAAQYPVANEERDRNARQSRGGLARVHQHDERDGGEDDAQRDVHDAP